MTERVVYIAEAFDFDDRGPIATGLFSCEARAAADDAWLGEYAELPLPLAEALAWGRSRADRVSARIVGAGSYSAGAVAGEHPPLDEAQRLVRRWAPESEFLDRSESDPLISWDVVVEVATPNAARIGGEGRVEDLDLGDSANDLINPLARAGELDRCRYGRTPALVLAYAVHEHTPFDGHRRNIYGKRMPAATRA